MEDAPTIKEVEDAMVTKEMMKAPATKKSENGLATKEVEHHGFGYPRNNGHSGFKGSGDFSGSGSGYMD